MLTKIKGNITAMGQKRSGVSQAGNAWTVQEFVITDERNDIACFEVFGEENIAKFTLGQAIEVSCSINCREWNGKYFTTLRYYAPKEEQVAPQSQVAATPTPTPTPSPQVQPQVTYAQPYVAPQSTPTPTPQYSAPNVDSLPF
jgi:hypothetical protein